MKKFLALATALVLTLSLAACGGGPDVTALKESYNKMATAYNEMATTATENGWNQDREIADGLNKIADTMGKISPIIEDPSNTTQEQIDELKTNCDNFYTWVEGAKDTVSVPYEAEPAESEPAQDGGPLNALALYAVPEGLPGTGWKFAGGCMNGAELDQAGADEVLAQYGGSLQIVFDDDTSISMIQGSGTLAGTYGAAADSTGLKIEFDNAGSALRYVGVFTEMGGTVTLVLMPDTTGMNGFYFTQISEG